MFILKCWGEGILVGIRDTKTKTKHKYFSKQRLQGKQPHFLMVPAITSSYVTIKDREGSWLHVQSYWPLGILCGI